MATFLRRKAAAVALGVLTLTLAGGGIAVAAQPAAKAPVEVARSGARQPGSGGQPPVTAAEASRARAAMSATLAPPAPGVPMRCSMAIRFPRGSAHSLPTDQARRDLRSAACHQMITSCV